MVGYGILMDEELDDGTRREYKRMMSDYHSAEISHTSDLREAGQRSHNTELRALDDVEFL
jgi:hypothetical protein